MKLTLDDIKAMVDALAKKINAPPYLLPTYGSTIDGAHPHIEIDGSDRLYYVVVERGQELKRDLAGDTNDLLYGIFAGITFSMACNFEAKHRIPNEDFRRQLFAKQEELLGMLNEEWRIRKQKEHREVLLTHPFEDK